MSITFRVSDVARPTATPPALSWTESLRSLVRKKVEQSSPPPAGRTLVAATDAHALAQAAHDAFYDHRPLVLTPDAVWFTLAQGFSQHVRLHSEELRHRFVDHEGKKKLVVDRGDFVLGRENPWPEAFAAFSEQVHEIVGKPHELIAARFSTTGAMEAAAFDVVVMDAFQGYFEYEMRCGCGIPSITLTGTVDDWRSIRTRAAALGEYPGLEEWSRALLPVLDKIVETAAANGHAGNVDTAFWQSFFRYQSGSGGSELTGWILTLFPYLVSDWRDRSTLAPNMYFATWDQDWKKAEARKGYAMLEGPGLLAIPSSIAGAPVKVLDVPRNITHAMRFVAGLVGVTMDADGALQPEFGWSIVYE